MTVRMTAGQRQRRADDMTRHISLGLTLEQVGRKYGLSRQRVAQIIKKTSGAAVFDLRDPIGPRVAIDHDARQVRRFWARVQPVESGCWEWIGLRYPTGYGHANWLGEKNAHRVAYRLLKGDIPEGLTLDHLCRNPPCVNPDHLEAVTHRENILRSPISPAAINARKTHCKHGHAFTIANTYQPPHGRGRSCRTCNRERSRRAYRARVGDRSAAA